MYLPTNKMNANSRVWVYTSNRKFSEIELGTLEAKLLDFTQSWLSHGDEVKASFSILHGCFIVLIADEKEGTTGGCSIDSTFKFIKKLEENYQVSLLDRQLLTFLIDDEVVQLPFSVISKEQKILNNKGNKIFFNTLVKNLEQLNSCFLVEPENSWIQTHL